jgi:hypothetical protein
MHFKSVHQSYRRRLPGDPPRVFNLDLHISVIADLEVALNRERIDLTRWSISGHNFAQRRRFRTPDPVKVVNAKTWKKLDDKMIDRFQDVYGRYLRSFDGFISCFTPTFSELFRGLDRPVLAMAATRYEAPYTTDATQWARFNEYVRAESKSGRMLLVANNRGDRDYCEYFLGFTPRYVPSLCDYTDAVWTGLSGTKIVQAADSSMTQEVLDESHSVWHDSKKILKFDRSWNDVGSMEEYFIVPYNISTMTLFELATIGVPVSVPSRRFLKEMASKKKGGALNQLTWFQVHGAEPPTDSKNPNNSDNEDFLDWWLDRADFYDQELMPNVRVVDSIGELMVRPHPATIRNKIEWNSIIRERNMAISEKRASLISDFKKMMS